MNTNLTLHAGAHRATLEDVRAVVTPAATDTWQPIAHNLLLTTILKQMTNAGLTAGNEEYGLWQDGLRMFATFELASAVEADFRLVVGIRNSHDKAFSAGLAVGSRVFVCDNLSFSGEITIARKHTRWIARDLPELAARAIGKISAHRVKQEVRFAAYKEFEVTDRDVHDLIVRSVDAKVMANSYIPKVLEVWRKPTHEEFAPRTAWSLFNAYTEIFKDTNRIELPRRTTRLHGLLDQLTGVAVAAPAVDEGMADVEVVDRT